MEAFFAYILQHSLLAGVVVLLLFLVRRVFSGRLSPRARHALWGFLIPVLLLPTAVVPIPVRSLETEAQFPARVEPVHVEPVRAVEFSGTMEEKTAPNHSVAIIQEAAVVPSSESASEKRLPSLFACLTAAWLVGMVGLITLSLMQVLRLRYRFRQAEKISDENVLSILEQCKTAMNVRSPVGLVESGRILCPALIGMMKPRIILPAGFAEQCGEEQLSHLLCHELAHLKRRDILIGYLASLLCFVHWFNPLVWIAVRKMNDDAEEAADQLVMQTLDRQHRIEYGRTLLSLAERYYSVSKKQALISRHVPGFVGLMESSTQLSRRIEMIKKHDTWRRGWMFLAVLLCFAVSTTTLVRVRFVEAQTVEQPKKEEAVSKPAAPKPKETEEKSGDSFGGLTWFQAAGKIIAPEQVDFKKFQIRSVCHSVTEPGHSGTSSTKIEEDGSFSGNVWGDRDYAFFFHDPDLRWAAKPVFLPVDKEDPKDEVVIQLEKGSLIEATLVNRETGKPISGMTVWLTQKTEWKETRSALETFSNSELLRTDENGQIKHCVTPGDFRFTVDMPNFSWGDGERLYSLDFTVKKGEDAKPVLKIPPPFVGQVLDENGEPVADASISMHGTTGDFLYTSSDKGGFFKRRTAPKNSMIEISKYKGQNRRLRSVRWVKDELKDDELWKIELTEGQTVTGRLLDAATGEPLSNTLFFYQYENPDNPRQKDFLPNSTRTDAEGYFKAVGLATGLNYRFFFVPGRIREYNGGPYSPRVELAFLKTDKPGESVDLGDLKVDPKQAVADRREQETENLDKRIAKELSAVVNGEKQGGLVVLVSSEDDPFLKQITERRNEEPFSSFAITVVNRNEFPEGFLEAFSGDAENCLFLVSPPVGEKHPLPVSLSQLRGEKDSPWNVPKDDASNQDDWKKTPGMVNPKILRAFLDDYLKR